MATKKMEQLEERMTEVRKELQDITKKSDGINKYYMLTTYNTIRYRTLCTSPYIQDLSWPRLQFVDAMERYFKC